VAQGDVLDHLVAVVVGVVAKVAGLRQRSKNVTICRFFKFVTISTQMFCARFQRTFIPTKIFETLSYDYYIIEANEEKIV
jgi:hypothetical protein